MSTLPDIAFGTNPFLGNIGAPLRDDTIDLGEETDSLEMEGPGNDTESKEKEKTSIQA